MTPLDELDRLSEKATPHERWAECSTPESDTKQVYTAGGEWSGEWVASFACREDADFAIALVNAFPEISKRLKAAEGLIARIASLQEQLPISACNQYLSTLPETPDANG